MIMNRLLQWVGISTMYGMRHFDKEKEGKKERKREKGCVFIQYVHEQRTVNQYTTSMSTSPAERASSCSCFFLFCFAMR
jgi:uncharacterized membrane-anchored protein